MNKNNIDFVPDLNVAKTASIPTRYESGAFRVVVEKIHAMYTKDDHPILSVRFRRLDGNGFIELRRMFLEEAPYGMPELSHCIIHDFIEFLGIKTSREDIYNHTLDLDKFNKELEERIGLEVIVLVHNEYTVNNDTTYVNTKLRMAFDKDGISMLEHERPNLRRGHQLEFVAKRIMPSATRSYMDKYGSMPKDRLNMKLLIDEFNHLFTDEELENFKNGLCGKTSWHHLMK